jgi:hypothetical protein
VYNSTYDPNLRTKGSAVGHVKLVKLLKVVHVFSSVNMVVSCPIQAKQIERDYKNERKEYYTRAVVKTLLQQTMSNLSPWVNIAIELYLCGVQ